MKNTMKNTRVFNKSKEEARKLWIEALRSGYYNQGYLTLCRIKEDNCEYYCCLGVACELYQKYEGGLIIKFESFDDISVSRKEYNGASVFLPPIVRTWLGIRQDDGGFYKRVGDYAYSLPHLNDNGKTFKEIADFIEEEPEGLWED